ncbi:molybdopterin-binding protein [Falsiphaeobacter marinintestinus]|uniref:molybdopterin-binding protein n=1 Tax=Falsiphaeobacter marinintestinus TaxID=1492905 RepID=UPI0011B44D76|nr:molybdopterin-binding protein [Phaeobacter marinintestinus]
MKFGPVPVDAAQGSILAHSLSVGDLRLRKGIALGSDHVAALVAAGVDQVIAARLDANDVHENEAARRLAASLVPDPSAVGLRVTDPFTGRVNLVADGPGVVTLDVAALERFNRIHPMITIATVPPYQQMGLGGMVATIKVISFAVPEADVVAAESAAPDSVRLAKPVFATAGLVVTEIPGGPDDSKGIRSIRGRIEALGMELTDVRTVAHHPQDLAKAVKAVGGEIAMILTGSATMDPDDVAPLSVRLAGGSVARFGMPVDPGNLLFLGQIENRPVIGLPGCARSPALNGADWVLSRVACGIVVTDDDISGMGVGGLLKEIPTRPQPRAGRPRRAAGTPPKF